VPSLPDNMYTANQLYQHTAAAQRHQQHNGVRIDNNKHTLQNFYRCDCLLECCKI